MKLKVEKTSAIVLWSCMLISLCVFGMFLWNGIIHSDEVLPEDSNILLFWMYIMFGLVLGVSFFFLLKHIVEIFQRKPKAIFKLLLPAFTIILMLIISFIFGDGNPLNLPQYFGNENTFFWLKIADMWIYSIFLLLGITVLAAFVGIIYSIFR